MNKSAGRPRGKHNKVAMAFRFRAEMAAAIKQLSARHRLPQARVLEILVARYGKEINL